MNKRGGQYTVFIGIAIAIIFAVLIIVFYNNIFGSAKINVDNKLTCQGAFGVGYGECVDKDQCEPPNQAVVSKDCVKDKKVCCLSLEKPDSLLPEQYGGNSEFNFVVEYIGPKEKPANCHYPDPKKDYEIVCTPGTTVSVNIKIGVKNTGTKPVDVFANPTIVDLSGSLSPIVKQGVATKINSGQKQEVFVEHTFKGPGTETGRSYRIYPAAKCISDNCKKTNADGIYRKLEGSYLNIAFVK